MKSASSGHQIHTDENFDGSDITNWSVYPEPPIGPEKLSWKITTILISLVIFAFGVAVLIVAFMRTDYMP